MRGERWSIRLDLPQCIGSAPHARGTHLNTPLSLSISVQPRMRGERMQRVFLNRFNNGSAPHARGTHRRADALRFRARFSPACAGNAAGRGRDGEPGAVQPRMRGERGLRNTLLQLEDGSAPHARGTRAGAGGAGSSRRFSPACAGNAGCRTGRELPAPVQPRMRGERVILTVLHSIGVGSAPHARGTPGAGGPAPKRHRFSPACAGNAWRWSSTGSTTPVQPRMRGERVPRSGRKHRNTGSAPHARGTHVLVAASNRADRFSPACAGNAKSRRSIRTAMTVQPRMRGERGVLSLAAIPALGSAPHARGTLRRRAVLIDLIRFSPACAGNATVAAGAHLLFAVQPRMRGERSSSGASPGSETGSAPHARGTRHSEISRPARSRFSPACAGNAHPGDAPRNRPTVQPRMRGERWKDNATGKFYGGSAPHARGTPGRD